MSVYTIKDNIFSSTTQFDTDSVERLILSRSDMQKMRMRKTGERGTDVTLSLNSGAHLHNGDIIEKDGTRLLIEQIPEKVITVTLPESKNDIVLLGHIIGNRHRPISVKDNTLSFPIQADSELETFKTLLAPVAGIELKVKEIVFESIDGADVHEH